MRRVPAILLLLCFLGLGTGAMEYFHEQEHAREDARLDAIAKAAGVPVPAHHEHDDSNCPVHAQLHLPLISIGWIPILVCLGLWIGFLTLLATPLIPRPVFTCIDCRGPPVCS
jgi:hypothetical protein